jgi:hypothetical protein
VSPLHNDFFETEVIRTKLKVTLVGCRTRILLIDVEGVFGGGAHIFNVYLASLQGIDLVLGKYLRVKAELVCSQNGRF